VSVVKEIDPPGPSVAKPGRLVHLPLKAAGVKMWVTARLKARGV